MILHTSEYTWLVSISCYYDPSREQIGCLNTDKVDKATIGNEIQIGGILEKSSFNSLPPVCFLTLEYYWKAGCNIMLCPFSDIWQSTQ